MKAKQNTKAINRVAKVTAAHKKSLPTLSLNRNQIINNALVEERNRRKRSGITTR